MQGYESPFDAEREMEGMMARLLLESGAVIIRPGTEYPTASAGVPLPGFKIEARTIASTTEALWDTCRMLQLQVLKQYAPGGEYGVQTIACVESGGSPFGTLLAHLLRIPCVYIGKDGAVVGGNDVLEGRRVLIVEDTVTTGGTTFRAGTAVAARNGNVIGVLALARYAIAGVAEQFVVRRMPLRALTTVPQVLDYAVQDGRMTCSHRKVMLRWMEKVGRHVAMQAA